jgi:DNA-binding HxlR family transcriptional regulator
MFFTSFGWYNCAEGAGSTHKFVSPEQPMKNNYGCPVLGTINAVSGKWKVLVIWRLGFGPRRFAELRNLLPGVSEKVLTAQLRELESDGILRREVSRSSPPKVTYSLSGPGEDLIEPMGLLCKWGTVHLGIPPNLPRYPKPNHGVRSRSSGGK